MRQDKDDLSANAHPSPVLTVKNIGFVHMFKESREPLCRKSINATLHCSQEEESQSKSAVRVGLFPMPHPAPPRCISLLGKSYLGSSREYD